MLRATIKGPDHASAYGLAIYNDEELLRMLLSPNRDTVIPFGGVLPNIHAVLLPKKAFKPGVPLWKKNTKKKGKQKTKK